MKQMWGLKDSEGNLVEGNLSTQLYTLFDTEQAAQRYVEIHHSGYAVVAAAGGLMAERTVERKGHFALVPPEAHADADHHWYINDMKRMVAVASVEGSSPNAEKAIRLIWNALPGE